MRSNLKTIFAILGTLLVIASVVGVFLVYLGPWRTCPDVGNNMGCEATPGDIGLLGVSILVFIVGTIFIAISMSLKGKKISSDSAEPFGELN